MKGTKEPGKKFLLNEIKAGTQGRFQLGMVGIRICRKLFLIKCRVQGES